MGNPQDPRQWGQQGWQQPQPGQPVQPGQQPGQPQYGGQQPYGGPDYGNPSGDHTLISQQFGGQPGQYPPPAQPQNPQYGSGAHQAAQFGGYPQQPGDFYPQYAGQPPAPKKSKTGLIVGIAATTVTVLVLMIVLVGWLTGFFFARELDNAAVNEGVTRIMHEVYSEPTTTNVQCETAGVPVEAEQEIDCTATIEGRQREIHLKIVNSDGTYLVGAPS